MYLSSGRRGAIGRFGFLGYDNLKIFGPWGNMKKRSLFFLSDSSRYLSINLVAFDFIRK